jgi:hypothetical protein
MWRVLKARNEELQHQLDELERAFSIAAVPPSLEAYRRRILSVCGQLQQDANRNLRDVALHRDEILEDVLSNTQQLMQYVRLLSARLSAPIVRANLKDTLTLATIAWVHSQHPATATVPAAFADGDCMIWPFVHIAPIYFFPFLEQRGLLYQPLLFHEFGHLLYVCHKQEMDDLVGELQREIEDVLAPPSQRNDRHADVQASQRQAIVDTWYGWAQELFCDGVGLTIGGPSFLWAFSGYLSTMQRGDFYRQPADLHHSSHPVTWLRVRLLAKRAKQAGFAASADEIEGEWSLLAQTMRVVADYHGFYDQALDEAVTQTVSDMLTEAAPRRCTESETQGVGSVNDPVGVNAALFNQAWQVYRGDPDRYRMWESEVIAGLSA